MVIDDYDSMVGGLREEFAVEKRVPDVLPPAQPQPPAPKIETGPEMQHEEVFEYVTIHDDLVVTPSNSCVMDAGGLGFLKPVGSGRRMFDRIVKARDLAIKRNVVEVTQEQFRSRQPEVVSVPVPPQP